MARIFNEKEIKAAIMKAMDEKQDWGYYDYDEEYHPDDSYYGCATQLSFFSMSLS